MSISDSVSVGSVTSVGFSFCLHLHLLVVFFSPESFETVFLECEECAHCFPGGSGMVFDGNASTIFEQVRKEECQVTGFLPLHW